MAAACVCARARTRPHHGFTGERRDAARDVRRRPRPRRTSGASLAAARLPTTIVATAIVPSAASAVSSAVSVAVAATDTTAAAAAVTVSFAAMM